MIKTVPDLSSRVSVASFTNYADAERAVDGLSDQGFPVEHTTICGVGLRLAENVLGRLTYPRAAAMGAGGGVWFGLLFGVFLAIFTPNAVWWLATILWGVLWGVVAGVIFGVVWHALSRGRRDFVSAGQLLAERYEVLVDPAYADRASQLLRTRQS